MTVAQHQSQEEPDEVRLDGEGNPIDDQPIVERVIDQWPLALVLSDVGHRPCRAGLL